jgi:RHS repeat-associated protein
MSEKTPMKKTLVLLLMIVAALSWGSASAGKTPRYVAASEVEPLVGRYFVTFAGDTDIDDETLATALARTYGGRLEPFAATGVRGAMMTMRPAKARAMSADLRVRLVEERPASERSAGGGWGAHFPAQSVIVGEAVRNPGVLAASALWVSGAYSYDGAGNITAIGGDSYRYDGVARLVRATFAPASSGLQQDFQYDAYGNLTKRTTFDAAAAPFVEEFRVDSATNRFLPPAACPGDICFGGKYDEAGNQVGTGSSTSDEFTFDALGVMTRLRSIDDQAYVYDTDNERILTIQFAGTTERYHRYAVRGVDNKVARELIFDPGTGVWSLARDYVYRSGMLIASFSSPTATTPDRHYHLDHLGSTRLVTDGAAFAVAGLKYWPFGQEMPGSDASPERFRFTGHERDSDGSASVYNLDYMHARYYSGRLSRFSSVDPVLDIRRATVQPQAWNRYTYVLNRPLNLIDPTGKYDVDCTGGSERDQRRCALAAERFEAQRQRDLQSKHAAVRNAAAAWGDPNDHNGITVAFRSQAQVNRSAGRTYGNTDAFVDPNASRNGVVNIRAEFVYKMRDRKMAQAIAHEGSHLEDHLAFIRSFDPESGTYSGGENFTRVSTEFDAYVTGSLVSPYPDFKKGPRGYDALENFIRENYGAPDALFYDPAIFPQR